MFPSFLARSFVVAPLAVASCALPSEALDPSHPANPLASEAPRAVQHSTLRADAMTLRTRELLSQRAQQAQAAEAEAPVAAPGTGTSSNPAPHEHP